MSQLNNVFFVNVIPRNDKNDDPSYLDNVKKYINSIDEDVFKYTLITIGNKRVDPWIMAQALMAENDKINPMIAVNPEWQHPFAIIKKISSLQSLYKNEIALNLIPGSFKQEMEYLEDHQSFEEKQERLKKFSTSLKNFLKDENLKIFPPLKKDKTAPLFFSGITEKSAEDFHISNLWPMGQMTNAKTPHSGLSLGICARKTNEEAQSALKNLYKEDRAGKMLFEMGLTHGDISWNARIKEISSNSAGDTDDFNLWPMKNFYTKVPFLVGSYEEVSNLLKNYVSKEYSFFVVDFHQDDFSHIKECIRLFKS